MSQEDCSLAYDETEQECELETQGSKPEINILVTKANLTEVKPIPVSGSLTISF